MVNSQQFVYNFYFYLENYMLILILIFTIGGNMNSFIRYCTAGLVGALTFLSLSAYANITVLAWPGGPAEGALKKFIQNRQPTEWVS